MSWSGRRFFISMKTANRRTSFFHFRRLDCHKRRRAFNFLSGLCLTEGWVCSQSGGSSSAHSRRLSEEIAPPSYWGQGGRGRGGLQSLIAPLFTEDHEKKKKKSLKCRSNKCFFVFCLFPGWFVGVWRRRQKSQRFPFLQRSCVTTRSEPSTLFGRVSCDCSCLFFFSWEIKKLLKTTEEKHTNAAKEETILLNWQLSFCVVHQTAGNPAHPSWQHPADIIPYDKNSTTPPRPPVFTKHSQDFPVYSLFSISAR